MAFLLALLLICMGIFFLNVFVHVAKLERRLLDQVTALEKYMAQRYNLSDTSRAIE